jgi:hypothetical protein
VSLLLDKGVASIIVINYSCCQWHCHEKKVVASGIVIKVVAKGM